jgi:hypothetical protein
MIVRKPQANILSIAAAGFAMALLAVPARAQQTAYAIANGGTTLIRFQTNAPGSAVAVGNFSLGGNATFLDAIDFRPLNGQLYGYLDSTDTLYTVNLTTAALTPVASGSGASATNTNILGIDFNPTIDRVRVVTDSTQNLVYNPNSNASPAVATSLFYGPGDPNENSNALIIDNAYSNNIHLGFPTTTQYVIDYGLDVLATLNNNAGNMTTVGALGVNTDVFTGFDIFTSMAGVNTGFAVLDSADGSAPTFYDINLATGAATSIGAIGGGFNQVYSLAVVPTASAAPEPASLALMALGILPIMRRRRRV